MVESIIVPFVVGLSSSLLAAWLYDKYQRRGK